MRFLNPILSTDSYVVTNAHPGEYGVWSIRSPWIKGQDARSPNQRTVDWLGLMNGTKLAHDLCMAVRGRAPCPLYSRGVTTVTSVKEAQEQFTAKEIGRG